MDLSEDDVSQGRRGVDALARAAHAARGHDGDRTARWLERGASAWVVLALSLLVTVGLWRYTATDQEHRVRERFEYLADKQRSILLQRVEDYDQMLQGVVGLFAASGEVTRQEFHDFVQALAMDQRLPGIQGTGYVVMLKPSERAAHEAAVRAQGFADYVIHPPGEREPLSSIVYLEPFSGRNLRAFGFDMYSEPVRRAAMEHARDTGMAALSGKVVLVQEEHGEPLPGFLLYLPLYRKGALLDSVEARRAALTGFVYSPFRAADLMRAIFRHAADDGEVEVYDGEVAPRQLLYASEQGRRRAHYVIDYPVEIADHRWTLRVRSSRDFERHYDSALPQLVLLGGLVVAALLFALLYLHARHSRAMTRVATELQRSRDRFQTLVENVPATVFRCEPRAPWRVSYISAGIEQLSGRSPACYLSGDCTLGDLVRSEDLAWVADLIDRAVERREVYAFDYLVDPAREFWVSARGRASYDGQGQPLWIDGVTFDISAQKRAERQLAEYRDLLERRVEERTAELSATAASLRRTSDAMAEARRTAEAANAAKSVFLSNMSHELRTPLNVIMGMGHLLRGSRLDARQQGQLTMMLAAGQDLLALIDDILNYVHIETSTLRFERRHFGLAALFDTVLGRVRDKAGVKGLRLRTELAPDIPPQLDGDARQIGQVLHKLAENAVKFTESGEVCLAASLLERAHDEVLLRFEVRDTGIGLSAEEQSRLFLTFEQGDGSATRRHGGTGLGLAIARRLVELLGGRIGVESEPARGSRFWFTVRLGVASGLAGMAATLPATPVPSETAPPASFDAGQWASLRGDLIGLLRQDDTDSLRLFEANAALLRAALGPAFERLADALQRFDFDAARTLLEAAC